MQDITDASMSYREESADANKPIETEPNPFENPVPSLKTAMDPR
jgi:hypothetical protein